MQTPEIDVSVQLRYLPEASAPLEEVYSFAYTVRIRNLGTRPGQLIARHWIIEDSDGQREEVRGLGVVGQQPLLLPGESFEYTSGCRLHTPTGVMRGHYRFITEEGDPFDAPIAPFTLDATGELGPRRLH